VRNIIIIIIIHVAKKTTFLQSEHSGYLLQFNNERFQMIK
jgi:hypothetical protein